MNNNRQIVIWLNESRLPVEEVSPNHWEIPMNHNSCHYTLTIIRHGIWLSYGADLIGVDVSPIKEEFFRRILQINARLNGTNIGIENDRLVLTRDDFVEDLKKYNLYRSINTFHQVHQQIYLKILQCAEELGVKLVP